MSTEQRQPRLPLPDVNVRTRTDIAAIVAVELCLLDGLMTLPHWHLESNPVVMALGPTGMLLVKLSAVCVLLWLWFGWDGVRYSNIARTCVWAMCCLYTVVVGTNLLVLTF